MESGRVTKHGTAISRKRMVPTSPELTRHDLELGIEGGAVSGIAVIVGAIIPRTRSPLRGHGGAELDHVPVWVFEEDLLRPIGTVVRTFERDPLAAQHRLGLLD